MRMRFMLLVLVTLTGCTAGPRASMFAPVGGSPVELMPPEVDPFLETPAPGSLRTPPLPNLGPVSSAARQQMWRAANSIGPAPKSLPSSIPLTSRTAPAAAPATESISSIPPGKVDAKPTSTLKGDGQRGFVQLMPPPPEDAEGMAASPRESRYFELPPPPEH